MITQTIAIFVDAYRELNARKMFWIVMILSGLAVGAFAVAGVHDGHLRLLKLEVPHPPGITGMAMYKGLFSYIVVGFWLTWAAAILALISTSSIFPEFVVGGAIDLYLVRPISRLRLFLTKYVAGLLFVALQVLVFCIVAYVELGLRAGFWNARIFLAVPIIVCFFSYLFVVCVLLGILTRSTMASLLVTLLFWVLIFLAGYVENRILKSYLLMEAQVEQYDAQIARYDQMIGSMEAVPGAATRPTRALEDLKHSREQSVKERNNFRDGEATMRRVHRVTYWIKTICPKTTETTDLLDRWLMTDEESRMVRGLLTGGGPETSGDAEFDRIMKSNRKAEAELTSYMRSRSIGWVVGTSLLFEGVVLAMAAWVFCRRDY